jgi:hypothetical protein
MGNVFAFLLHLSADGYLEAAVRKSEDAIAVVDRLALKR